MTDFAGLNLEHLVEALAERLEQVYRAERPMPEAGAVAEPASLPEQGLGMEALPALWTEIAESSTKLASPWMLGHMDTAPHPAAALTDALVSALNNNLLFRELSPFASQVEERLLADIAKLLGLAPGTPGLVCSGGSLANLTGLFAACGGFSEPCDRRDLRLFVARGGHASVLKAASVLGIPADAIVVLEGDACGRLLADELKDRLRQSPDKRKIVVSVLGTTIHGALDDLSAIAGVCRANECWLHADAIYGGALAFSDRHRDRLKGLDQADSLAIAPQKWMYVPRVSALLYLRDPAKFESALARPMPYSQGDKVDRGTWGLQGSRRADAVTLWTTLQVLGRAELGQMIDSSIDLAQRFCQMLEAHPMAEPSHRPDLNLQTFRWGPPDPTGGRLLTLQAALAKAGRGWLSVSRWRDESLLRSVLLPSGTSEEHLARLLEDLERASR